MESASIPAPVRVIAGDGMADMTEMDADLVDTSRLQYQFEEGKPVVTFEEMIVCNRMTTTHPCYCHLPPVSWTSDDTGIDGSSFVGGDTANDSVVVACGGVCLKLSRKMSMCVICLSGDNHAGGVFVETMHDAGALNAADAGEGFTVVEQRIDQRAGLCLTGGMDSHTCRFVHDDQSGIFMQKIEWNRFRVNGPKGAWVRKRERNLIAGSELVAGLGRFAVYSYSTFSNQFLDVCSGQRRRERCIHLLLYLLYELCFNKAVESKTLSVWGNVEDLRF